MSANQKVFGESPSQGATNQERFQLWNRELVVHINIRFSPTTCIFKGLFLASNLCFDLNQRLNIPHWVRKDYIRKVDVARDRK